MPRNIRQVRVHGNTAFVTLTKGYVAIIDADDLEIVNTSNWYASVKPRTVYAIRAVYNNGAQHILRLHRIIMKAPFGMEVDHINGNGLDNRKINLRVVSKSENAKNRRIGLNNRSGFKGVSWSKKSGKWLSQIQHNGIVIYLGYYASKEEAYEAYCKASEKYHGEFGSNI